MGDAKEVEKKSTFETVEEIWKHLISGGKVLNINSNGSVYFLKDGFLHNNKDNQIVNLAFANPKAWEKFVEPEPKEKRNLYVLKIPVGHVSIDGFPVPYREEVKSLPDTDAHSFTGATLIPNTEHWV